MIQYRPFLTSDALALAEIWNEQIPIRARAIPMTPSLFERFVFSKPYFDRDGLIVAVDAGNRPVGFVHAGFGADDDGRRLDLCRGVVSMLQTTEHPGREETMAALLARGEEYLRGRGAKLLYAGEIFPLDPFYLGLYGGSEAGGLAESDEPLVTFYRTRHYREIDRVTIFQRPVRGIGTFFDPRQAGIQRRYIFETIYEPMPETWWEACSQAALSRVRFQLRDKGSGAVHASVTFTDMETFYTAYGRHAIGLVDLWVADEARRQGLAGELICRAVRHASCEGKELIESQTMQSNTAAVGLYGKLGFKPVEQSIVFRKETG